MTIADIAAILSNEPFNRSMPEIKRLTMFQVRNVLFRDRDSRTGKLDMDKVYTDPEITDRQRFEMYCTIWNLPGWWVRKKHARR